jgi:hypothetical protein
MKHLLAPARPFALSLILTALAVGVGSTHAQTIDVNFYSQAYGGSTATGAGVVGTPTDVWNGINGDGGVAGGPFALVNTLGTPTAALAYLLAPDTNPIAAIAAAALGTQQNPSLMNDYLFNNQGGDIIVELAGLTPSANYDLYLYLSSDDSSNGARSVGVDANGVIGFATGDPTPTFTAGSDYLPLAVTASASGTLLIIAVDGPNNSTGEIDMNGLQLVRAPDQASTLALLAIGVCALALAARRVSSRAAA